MFVVRLKAYLSVPSALTEPAGNGDENTPPSGQGGIPDIVKGILPTLTNPTSLPAPTEAPPGLRSKERVNILLIGVDQRPDEANQPTRTDTMLIVTIDPYSKSAGILSIPRDLWVPIPIDDRKPLEDRINTAHVWGDWYKYPGGGPALAKKTVQYNFGVKIHYYAKVDFAGFRKLVDALGGIDVDVPVTLYDEAYPTDDYGYMVVHIPKGQQHLNGEQALQYARSRHQDSDFGRMSRQRQVLLALRERALKLDILPRLPQMAIEYRDIVKTDMPIPEALALASIAKDIDADKVQSRAIEGDAVQPTRTALGADILLPVRKEIEKIVSDVFFDARLREEGASVEVLNATKVPGLATQAVTLLERRGFNRVSADMADTTQDYSGITIIDYTSKKYSVGRLAEIFKVPAQQIETRRDPTSSVDIRVVLGKDAKIPQ